MLNEVRNPVRTLKIAGPLGLGKYISAILPPCPQLYRHARCPKSFILTAFTNNTGICAVLYILANVAYFAAATPAEVGKSGVTVASFFFSKVFGAAAARALSVIVALSALGNVLTITFAQARVNQELAKEGVIPFPRFWASAWPSGSPSAGLLLHFIPSFIVIVAIPFGKHCPTRHSLSPSILLFSQLLPLFFGILLTIIIFTLQAMPTISFSTSKAILQP